VCPSGTYTGKLTGTYVSAAGLSRADVGATITFSVTATGVVTGTYTGPSSATATLAGAVDCSTLALSLTIENGTYLVGFRPVNFTGTIGATYSRTTTTFVDGTWTMSEPSSAADGGSGTWTQTKQ
jgi:hypothetical protein